MKKLILLVLLILVPSTGFAYDFTISVPTVLVPKVVDAYCARFAYLETINGQPNPESRTAFTKRMIITRMRNDYKQGVAILEMIDVNALSETESSTFGIN